MVELRLYPDIRVNNSIKIGEFECLPSAWKAAEELAESTEYNLRDFFTIEVSNETSKKI